MKNNSEKIDTHLCKFLHKRGYSDLYDHPQYLHDYLDKLWSKKPYSFYLDVSKEILSFVVSASGCKRSPKEDKVFMCSNYLLRLTKILDTLTTEPYPSGLYSRSRNSAKSAQNKPYYRNKGLATLAIASAKLGSVKFSKLEKQWLAEDYNEIVSLSQKLDLLLMKIKRNKSTYDDLVFNGIQAFGGLIDCFDGNQRLVAEMVSSIISDLKSKNIKVYNLNKFAYSKLSKTIKYEKPETWFTKQFSDN